MVGRWKEGILGCIHGHLFDAKNDHVSLPRNGSSSAREKEKKEREPHGWGVHFII